MPSIFIPGPQGPQQIRAEDLDDGAHLLGVASVNTDGTPAIIYLHGPQGPVPIRVMPCGDGTHALPL